MAGFDASYTRPLATSRQAGRPFLFTLIGGAMLALAFVIAIGVPLLLSGVTGFNLWEGEGISMQPTIYAGDFVVTHDVSPDELKAGDIILYDNGEKNVMHRIVGFTTAQDGDEFLIVRGDNNPVNDPPVPESALIGKLVYELSWLPKSPVDLSGTGLFVAEWIVSMALAATGMILLRQKRPGLRQGTR
jgi:signal peptidase I